MPEIWKKKKIVQRTKDVYCIHDIFLAYNKEYEIQGIRCEAWQRIKKVKHIQL